MKKKLLMGALVMFGLGTTLTGCVDNTESASVTAVRQAKAEQLKSIADLNKANADKIKLLAESEKALKDAEVDYKKAQTAYEEARSEIEKAEASIALQKAQSDLEVALAKAEEAIAHAKYQKLYYSNMIDGMENEAAKQLLNLITAFNNASKNLIEAKRDLAISQMELTRLETGRVSAKESLLNDIATLESKNEELTADIAEQQAIIDTYSAYAGKTVTQEEVNAAKVKYVEAKAAAEAAGEKAQVAFDAKTNAESDLEQSDYITKDVVKFVGNNYKNPGNYVWNYLISDPTGYMSIYGHWSDPQSPYSYLETDPVDNSVHNYQMGVMYIAQGGNSSLPKASLGKWNVVIFKPNHELTCIPVVDPIAQDEEGYTSYLNLIDNGKGLQELASYMDKVYSTEYFNKVLADAQKTLTTLEKTQADAQKAFDTADKAYTDAKAATAKAKADYEAAKAISDKEGATDAQIADTSKKLTAYNEAETAETNAQTAQKTAYAALKTAITNVNDQKALINGAAANAEDQKASVEDYKNNVAAVIASAPSNVENIAAYNKAVAAAGEASDALTEANTTANELQAEYQVLKNALDYDNGVVGGNAEANSAIQAAQTIIDNSNAAIEQNKSDIAEKQGELAKLDTIEGTNAYGEFYDELIAEKKAEVEANQVAVDTAQQAYDVAKALLDAALADNAE